MNKPKTLVQTRVDVAVHKKLVRAAEAEGISVADYLRRLVIQSIAGVKEVHRG